MKRFGARGQQRFASSKTVLDFANAVLQRIIVGFGVRFFMNVVIAPLVTFGITECAQAQLLNPLRVVEWRSPNKDFRPESLTLLLRSMGLEKAYLVTLPRYTEFRSDIVRIGAATASEWYLVPLAPNPFCETADCGVINGRDP